MTPVFLLSLPRSGSTLIQRILACHSDIATSSEPWLMLPLFYALRNKGVHAEYEHVRLSEAIEDFFYALPGNRSDYISAIKEMSLELYEKASDGAPFYLDKTPRYHLIINELLETFPEARFIIIWRNPLAVAASMIETWGKGKWNLHWFEIDLKAGIENLVTAFSCSPDRFLAINFEDFIKNPETYTHDIFSYIGVDDIPDATHAFSEVNLDGRMGDPTGIRQYKKISTESLEKWKLVFNNPARRYWARKYLSSIKDKTLETMGYERNDLEKMLVESPLTTEKIGSDLLRMLYGRYYNRNNKKLWNYK